MPCPVPYNTRSHTWTEARHPLQHLFKGFLAPQLKPKDNYTRFYWSDKSPSPSRTHTCAEDGLKWTGMDTAHRAQHTRSTLPIQLFSRFLSQPYRPAMRMRNLWSPPHFLPLFYPTRDAVLCPNPNERVSLTGIPDEVLISTPAPINTPIHPLILHVLEL